jgi:eukaryotic-like serine/threonine-protein kinase
MGRFVRIVLLTLVLTIVAMISALTAMQMAIHGREVAIPKVVGMAPNEAERVAASLGLLFSVERQFYSPDVPEGRIMAQTPAPGTRVRRGWEIRVAQSLGPQRVAIPDVTGESERAAELNIRRRGLALGSVAQVSLPDVPQDHVASQSPPANASGISAPKINLLVSAGPAPLTYVMPNLIGQPLGSASLTLQDAGMRLGKVSVSSPPPAVAEPQAQPQPAPSAPSEPNPASMIVTQTPAPGQKVVVGTAVNFEVR